MEHLLPAGPDVRTLLGDDFEVREGRAHNGITAFYGLDLPPLRCERDPSP